MNARLAAMLAKPATPQPSALHDARGMPLAEIIAWPGVRWRSFDPEDDVLDYVHASVGGEW